MHLAMRGWLALRSRLQPGELDRADLVVGLSKRFNELLRADYGVPPDKLRVLYTPVDLERFSPNGTLSAANPRTLLFVSRVSARKGVEEIVELSHRLNDLAGSVRLVIVGGATMWSDYRGNLADLNPAIAEYVGPVPTEQLPDLLRSAAMLVVPSRYEPGSIVTAEALACGVPVVLSDAVGNGEVAAGPHVKVHRAGDVDGLEAAIRSLLNEAAGDEQALRVAARANAEQSFAVDMVVAQLVDMIAALGPRRAAPPDATANSRSPNRPAPRVDSDDLLAHQ
jgi:glycosyltransferase involved in cell wall biosynthesis